MRRRIRFTGRKQIPLSSVEVHLFEVGDSKKLVSLVIHEQSFPSFPGDARVRLRMFENKFFETLEFGTLDALSMAYLENTAFSAPSCQLRIVTSDSSRKGLILGSTKTWTLRNNDEDKKKGILLFKPSNISPRTWKLDIRDDDYPIVYIDQKITNPGVWVRSDPVFISCVLPAIIREVFEDILVSGDPSEQEWMQDWLRWADSLMPGKSPPSSDDHPQKQEWIGDLLDSFCQKNHTLDMLLDRLKKEDA